METTAKRSFDSNFEIINIYSDDFKHGTYRITKPGYYRLKENIIFEPNSKYNYFPRPGDENYNSSAYVLGFFAAICIETDHVILDLNGKTLEYSMCFSLQQRYGALIELASAPFPMGRGPADFGSSVTSASYCIIKNGKLGLSSHHGIHGNSCHHVIIRDMEIRDFEVGAISFNNVHHITIENVKIGPNRQEIPVLSTYSHARFLLHMTDSYISKYSQRLTPKEIRNIIQAKFQLEKAVNDTFKQIIKTGQTTNKLFRNETGLLDGAAFGIVIYTGGVASDDFQNDLKEKPYSSNIKIRNVSICDIKCNVREVVAISQDDGKSAQFDAAGGVLHICEIMDKYGRYKGDTLSDLQITLAKPGFTHGIMNISKSICKWATSGKRLIDIAPHLKFKCNGDSMFHVLKGSVGLRIDGVENFNIEHCSIDSIVNIGYLGDDVHGGSYKISHDLQVRPYYHGADTYGMSIAQCRNGSIGETRIRNIVSYNGQCRGLCLLETCKNIDLYSLDIKNIFTGYLYRYHKRRWYGKDYRGKLVKYRHSGPNMYPKAIGLGIENRCDNLQIDNIRIHGISGPNAQKIS